MNPNLIACAVLFGPAAAFGSTAAVSWWRHRGELEAAIHATATMRAQPHQAPPDGGLPEPAAEPLADVIPFPNRRAA